MVHSSVVLLLEVVIVTRFEYLRIAINLGHVDYSNTLALFLSRHISLGLLTEEIKNAAGIAPFIVVPRDKLDEVVIQRDTSLGIEDRRGWVATDIGRDNVIFGVRENALELTLSGLLDGCLDLVVGGTLFDPASQVDDRDVGSGNAHGHAGELAIEAGNDLADRFSGTSATGNDVLRSSAATTPILS